MKLFRRKFLRLAAAATLCVIAPAAHADVAAFYKGKIITMMIGGAAGGGPDLFGRLLARYLPQYVPGNPNIIVQNMPGSGSLQMANYVYNSAVRDGTVIGAPFSGMPTAPLLQPRAARFDPTKLIWLGSGYRSDSVAYVWHAAPVQSLDQLKSTELVLGSQGPGSISNDLGSLARDVLGLKYKIVRGYRNSPEVSIAMERGEVQAQIDAWSNLMAQRPTWVAEKKVIIIGHFSLDNPPALRPYARMVDLAKTDEDRQAMLLVLARDSYGRPYFLPPDVPNDRVEALRRAFDIIMKDPAFITEAKKSGFEIDPMTGEATQALITRVVRDTSPQVVERVRRILDTQAN
jgi:tripartite-type tricarboxylate transporter receptor subunit TctC